MRKIFSDSAWDDYLYWQNNDKVILKRINQLIKDIERNNFDGIGKPEPLKGNYSGWWSRRVNNEHRIIYKIENGIIEIYGCRGHYDD